MVMIMYRMKLLVCLIMGAILAAGCSQKTKIVKKGEIPDDSFAPSAVARIDSLLGYEFSWKFNRKQAGMLPGMRAELSGEVGVPDRIHIRGSWMTGTATEKVDSYSIEGREYNYSPDTKTWERRSTGSFLDPHEHLKLVLSFGEFSFDEFGSHKGEECYVFAFKPNVYFLDPIETSEPVGQVWISSHRGIPVRVRVTSKKGVLSWDMELSAINSFADLNVPFKQITFRIPDIVNSEDLNTIVERFRYLGFEEPALERTDDGAVISVKAEDLSDALIEDLLKKGSTEVFLGVWPTHPIYVLREDTSLLREHYGEEARLLFERGVITKPIIAVSTILTGEELQSYELKNDLLGAYSLYAIVSPEARDSVSTLVRDKKDEPVVALIDGVPLLISNIRDAWIVEQKIPLAKGLEGREAVRIFARLRGAQLEKDYTFIRMEKEE